MKFVALVFTLSLGLTLGACSTASVRVMPGAGGTHHAVARDHEQEGAEEAAVKGANEYCQKHRREAVFVQDKSRYTGKMDENTRNTIRKASTAAFMLGGFGSPLQTAGSAGHMMTNGRDYESRVAFQCR